MATEGEINDYFTAAAKVVATAYHQAMRGGEPQAFIRQGFNELGAALKAFPDSIQHDEPGQVFNPIYHDMVEDRQSHNDAVRPATSPIEATNPLASPEKSAGDHATASPEHQQGSVHGLPGGGLQGPERGVYGPEHGVYGRDNGMQAEASARQPTPSEIADGHVAETQQDRGNVHGQEGDKGQDAPARDSDAATRSPTPSEIADGHAPHHAETELAQRQPVGPFSQREVERERIKQEQGDASYEPAQERSKADEEKAKVKEIDRGLGR